MKIRRVRLVNFQAHRETELEFSDGLNAIVGPTDAGKSSVVRAIRWVLFAEPAGETDRRPGTDRTSVLLEVEDGQGRPRTIERIRSAKVNRYLLDGDQFDAVGRDVPEPVREVLRCDPVPLAGRSVELSVACQLDSAFLLGWTGGDRAQLLDCLCGNDVASRVVGGLNRDVLAAGREEAEAAREVERLTGEVESIGDLEAERRVLRSAREAFDRGRRLASEADALADLLDRWRDVDLDAKGARTALARIAEPPDLRDLEDVVVELAVLSRLLGSAETVRSTREETLWRIGQEPREVDLGGLDRTVADLVRLERIAEDLEDLEDRDRRARIDLEGVEERERESRRLFDETLEEVGRCPLCGQNTSEEDSRDERR